MRFIKMLILWPVRCRRSFFSLPFPTHSHSSRCIIGPAWNAYRFSTMHHLLACVMRTVGGSGAFPETPTCGRLWRQTASGCHGGKTQKPKQNQKNEKKSFHFWRRRYVFGLLIAGDCDHSAAQPTAEDRLSSAGGGGET